MNDNLVSAGASGSTEVTAANMRLSSTSPSGRPANLPEKFWDDKTSQVRIESLLKSYLDLERKLSSLAHRDIPPRPEDYEIAVRDDLLTVDPGINERLHQAGFSREQAQLVYDLACDHLLPMIGELASLFEADSQGQRLEQHFGGKERWREVARQISAWGRSHLPPRVFEALSTTFEGVITMHRMMSEGDEPGLSRDSSGGVGAVLTDVELKSMMRDPRYWRDHDPVFVKKVRDGFRQLYAD
jgi:hypothetical protein